MKNVIRDVANKTPVFEDVEAFEIAYRLKHPFPQSLTPEKITAAWTHYKQLTRQKKRQK